MNSEQNGAKTRAQRLKELRERYQVSVTRTQALVKEQSDIRRQIRLVLAEEAKSVPEIAQACGLPADKVFWYLMAMKKYGQVLEQGLDGQYYKYQWKKEPVG
jgi:predicted transcriptional regulator